MFDAALRPLIDPALDRIGRRLARAGVTADHVTLAGLALALAAGAALALSAFGAALALLLSSRLADGLDGAVARATRRTDRGGWLDIVCDYGFYAAIPLGFALADPAVNALPACVLLASFYLNAGTFLGYAILAEKHGRVTARRGAKSLYFTGGLAEGAETIAVFVLACLVPALFPWLAFGFAGLTLVTAVSRLLSGWGDFPPPPHQP